MRIYICFKCLWCGKPQRAVIIGTCGRDVEVFADQYRTCVACLERTLRRGFYGPQA